MQPTLQFPAEGFARGKRTAAPVATTADAAVPSRLVGAADKKNSFPSVSSHRLIITDPTTGIKFLIDSGSDVSIVPRQVYDITQPSDIQLYAANNARIRTYGCNKLTASLGL